MRDLLRQGLNLVGALVQGVSPGWAYATGVGQPIWERSDAVVTPATPATYAFGIWSFIFLACLIYAVYQALPAQREDALLRRVGWFSAGAFSLNALWSVVQQTQGVTWLTVVLIFAILAASVAAFIPVAATCGLDRRKTVCVVLPLGVLAGWIAAASPVNIDQALAARHVALLGLSPTAQSILTLVASTALSSALLVVMHGNPIFAAGPVWALIGVVVASLSRSPTNLHVASAASGLAALFAVFATSVRRREVAAQRGRLTP